jgi:hypothetical protein
VTIDRRTFLRSFAAGSVMLVARRLHAAPKVRALALLPPASPLIAAARMGAEEARQTAALFGHEFDLSVEEVATPEEARSAASRARGYSAITGGLTASLSGAIAGASPIPYLELTDAREHIPDGRYRLSPVGADASLVAWHPHLKRFGAGELNERFLRVTQRRMDSASWTVWLAMKIILEASLYETDIASLQLDGHKGAPLRFDAQRVLQQPLYRVDGHGNLVDR